MKIIKTLNIRKHANKALLYKKPRISPNNIKKISQQAPKEGNTAKEISDITSLEGYSQDQITALYKKIINSKEDVKFHSNEVANVVKLIGESSTNLDVLTDILTQLCVNDNQAFFIGSQAVILRTDINPEIVNNYVAEFLGVKQGPIANSPIVKRNKNLLLGNKGSESEALNKDDISSPAALVFAFAVNNPLIKPELLQEVWTTFKSSISSILQGKGDENDDSDELCRGLYNGILANPGCPEHILLEGLSVLSPDVVDQKGMSEKTKAMFEQIKKDTSNALLYNKNCPQSILEKIMDLYAGDRSEVKRVLYIINEMKNVPVEKCITWLTEHPDCIKDVKNTRVGSLAISAMSGLGENVENEFSIPSSSIMEHQEEVYSQPPEEPKENDEDILDLSKF